MSVIDAVIDKCMNKNPHIYHIYLYLELIRFIIRKIQTHNGVEFTNLQIKHQEFEMV